MYSNIRSVQILISLMKHFGIEDVVLSPGGSDIPIIHSIETDEFFTCYSVVDERSAAYYALGVAQEKKRPVACVCTSGTAVCNYVPGITEAFYQNVPVLAITADKNPYYQDQLETQKIKQINVFANVIKRAVELPIVKSDEDDWLCNRLINEALLALTHNGTGPVQINIPIVGATNIYNCEVLPLERKISYVSTNAMQSCAEQLVGKKIMVVVGQNVEFDKTTIEYLNRFYKMFNCIFAVENLSNLKCDGSINTYPITEMCNSESWKHLLPEIVISIGNNLAAYQLKPIFRSNFKMIDNWLVSESGEVRDAYKCLTSIFQMSPGDFFESITMCNVGISDHSYHEAWVTQLDKITLPEFEFSNFYVAQQLARIIPENSILHCAILNSTRIMQFFSMAEGVTCYSNVGALGIDGCFSTFAGQAAASPEKMAYLVIGDLSFFYDMNAAGLRSIGPNVRVILLNNGGGSEFQFFMGRRNIPTIDSYICAEHEKVATGWIVSLDYDYFSASTKEEFDAVIHKFGDPSEKPLFLEVFTDMVEEADRTNAMYDAYRKSSDTGKSVKSIVGSLLSTTQKDKVKRILKILKEK